MRILRPAVLLAATFALLTHSPTEALWPFNGAPVCTEVNFQRLARLCGDGSGGAIVVWQDSRDGANPDIYAQRIDTAGGVVWMPGGAPVCTTDGSQVSAGVAPDGAGGAIVVWADYRSGTEFDVYAQRIDATGAPLWTLNGEVVCDEPGSQSAPQLIADGAGGAIVVWVDYRGGSVSDIYAQRIDASGATQWAPDGVAICTATDTQNFPLIVGGASGDAIIVWEDERHGDRDIFAQRVDGLGTPLWATDGDTVCAASGNQWTAAIDGDAAGGFIATWLDERGADRDVYAQRLNDAGVPQWTADGVVVCDTTGNQQSPAIAVDNFGNAVIAWDDGRGTYVDIYAQRLTNSGSGMWADNGVVVCDFPSFQVGPEVVAVAGGTIVAWIDRRNGGGNDDIYTQKIDMSGAQVWRSSSVLVTGAVKNQLDIRMIPDGPGDGAFITWMDLRNGVDTDIYANHISDSLAIGIDETVPEARGFTLLGNGPNPFGGATTIRFSLPEESDVRLEVFDVAGRRVFARSYREFPAGLRSLDYGGRDQGGLALPSGVYMYRVTAAGVARESKMIIVR